MLKFRSSAKRQTLLFGAAFVVLAGGAIAGFQFLAKPHASPSEVSSQRRAQVRYTPSASEWASVSVENVSEKVFCAERTTEGKIAVDEDRATPVYSPYVGRVTRLLARPGDQVIQGQPLFVIEATDTVQAQNDFMAAMAALNKAKSQLDLARVGDKRARDLYEGKAAPLKDYEQAQAALITAQNDMRASETALLAARNKLKILGFNDDAVASFQQSGSINPETTVYAPIAGTVVQRKVGPGQYISANASDPVFVIGDLSTVWLTAFVRESETASIENGQDIKFDVLAMPGRKISGRINYVAAAIDPATRRLLVRATVDNSDRALKPEMFANVTIYAGCDSPTVGVPKQALIYEGDQVRVWVVHEDKTIELRKIKTGLSNGDLVEVLGNLERREKIVTRGSLFIDRAASGS